MDEEEVERLVAFLDIDKMRGNPMVNKAVEKPPTEEAPSFIRCWWWWRRATWPGRE